MYYFLITMTLALTSVPMIVTLRCFACNRLKNSIQAPCPGMKLMSDSKTTEACRFLALSNGTVINQEPVSKELCKEGAFQAIQLQMALDFLEGEGIISCCTWDGCNGDSNKATRTRTEYEKHLLEKTEKFEKFSLQTTSNKNHKLAVFFERRSPTYFPTFSTSKSDDDYVPVEFVVDGGQDYTKYPVQPVQTFTNENDYVELQTLWEGYDTTSHPLETETSTFEMDTTYVKTLEQMLFERPSLPGKPIRQRPNSKVSLESTDSTKTFFQEENSDFFETKYETTTPMAMESTTPTMSVSEITNGFLQTNPTESSKHPMSTFPVFTPFPILDVVVTKLIKFVVNKNTITTSDATKSDFQPSSDDLISVNNLEADEPITSQMVEATSGNGFASENDIDLDTLKVESIETTTSSIDDPSVIMLDLNSKTSSEILPAEIPPKSTYKPTVILTKPTGKIPIRKGIPKPTMPDYLDEVMNHNGDGNDPDVDIDRVGQNYEDFDDDVGNVNLEEGWKRNDTIESYAVGGNSRFGSKFGVIYSDQYSKDIKPENSSGSGDTNDSSVGYLENFAYSSTTSTASTKETFSSSKSPEKPLIRSVRNSGLQHKLKNGLNISLSALLVFIICEASVSL